MKNTLKSIIATGKLVRSQLFYCLFLFLGLAILNDAIIIPVFRLATTLILQMAAIPLISYQNIITILTAHPFAVLFMLLELIALLLVIYFEFALMLWFIKDLRHGSLKDLKAQFKASFKNFHPTSLPLLLLYTLVILPFASVFFRTPLLAKVKVPEFILSFLTKNPLYFTLMIVGWLLLAYLAFRWVLILPLMVLENLDTKSAFQRSWELTRKKRLPLLGKLILLTLFNTVLYFLLFGAGYIIQAIFDTWVKAAALPVAVVNLIVMQLGSEILSIFSTVVAISFLFPLLNVDEKIVTQDLKPSKKLKVGFTVTATLITLLFAANGLLYFTKFDQNKPLIISHRGVSEENGVQNTLPALRATSTKLKPDYVEMDIHETKDGQFVVMHDENYRVLTGVNKRPIDLTLAQATKLTAKENGHQAKVPSFSEYLKAADQLHQKLLIEVKTTKYDSSDMLERFNKLYSATIIKHHHLIHSLDYNAVSTLKKLNPKLTVYYIQPYNFSYPNSVADGFSMEYSTLNDDFVIQAHLNNKPVFTWDMDEEDSIMRMIYYGVDGLITDDVQLARSVSKDYMNKTNYADQVLNFVAFNFS